MLIRNRFLAFYLALCLLILLFWDTGILYPFRMLAVFFHELGHLTVAILTGGRVGEFVLKPMEGGHVLSYGGNTFLVAFMGYPSSILVGVIIFYLSSLRGVEDFLTLVIGFLVGAIGMLFGRGIYTLIFSVFMSIFFIVSALFSPSIINAILLRVVGLTSILYTPYDIFTDIFLNSGWSDAQLLAGITKIGPTIWGIVWLALSIFMLLFLVFWVSVKDEEEITSRGLL